MTHGSNPLSVVRLARQATGRTADQSRGVGRQALRFAGSRALETQIPNLARLPVKPTVMTLQDADGNYLSIPGYNAPEE